MTILSKIEHNSIRYPHRAAIIEKSTSSVNSLTWEELEVYSNRLAFYIDNNLKTKTPIIVYGHKNPFMIVCFLACVKSGRAYCPIDINVPYTRIVDIVNEVNPEIILTTEELCTEDIDNKVLTINDIKYIIKKEKKLISKNKYVKKNDVFYIIFTSGSTGKPKGVQITRDCLDNFIKWAKRIGCGLKRDTYYSFINQAPFSFDLSVMDLYLSLYTGGTLWVLTKKVQSNMKFMFDILKESKADVWVSTPSFADVCLSDQEFCNELLPNLKEFLFCGEVLTNVTVSKLHKRFPTVKVVNTYGPTESTCAITNITITKSINKRIAPLPVGKPKKGTWLNIIDEKGNVLKDAEKGELVIIGDSVSIGYFNNKELTEKKFGIIIINNKEYRYYHTGDECYLINNMLYYCGRIDLQIKLHGYRIEIEDIENNLMKIDGVIQTAVVPKYKDNKVNSLAAFIIYKGYNNNDFETGIKIKNELKSFLPEYMIPKKIIFMNKLPRTNNGKIDRKALGELL